MNEEHVNGSGSECLLRMITVAKVAGEDACELVDMCRAGGCMSRMMKDRCLSIKSPICGFGSQE